MDYEKKLKLAKEALDSGSYDKETIEYIFPELAENEDERIKKCIIDTLKGYHHLISIGGVTKEQMIAWLEKQKAVDILDEEEREFADNVDSYRKEVDAAYQKGYNEGVKATLEKQGEEIKELQNK